MVCYQDVFERAYISDKLTRVGRRAARDPHRPQPVTGSRLIGVHTFSSMNFKDMPELPKSSKTDRLHFRNSGVIVEEVVQEDSNGPMVRVSLLLSLMPSKLVLKEVSQSPRMRVAVAAGHEVAKKYRKWLQTLALGVSHFAEAAKPAVTMQHLSKMTWTESDHCYLCLKTFRTYRRRHHCRFCGEAVCGSCSGFVDMGSLDVNYEGSEGSSDSITVGHQKLDVRMASDGSGRSLGSENASQKDNTEEFMDTRGCNTCVSELQMNLMMLGHAQSQKDLSLDSNSSSGSLSQLVNARIKHKTTGHDEDYSGVHGPPPPYPGRDSNYERDQVMPMRAGDYQLYEQYSGQKMSFSTISSSSYSGLSQDEKQAHYSSNWAEFMGKPPPMSISKSSNQTPSSYSTSDASLSAFLARDPDILSLNGLTISPGGSVMTNMDDDEYSDLAYKRSSQASGNRASYATTAATNEGSNHSQFNFSNMTTQEMQATDRLIREANSRGNVRVNGRPPDTRRHQPRYQPEYEQNPAEFTNKRNYHVPPRQGGLSPSHSQTSSYSSSSTHSDMIQLNIPTRGSRAPNKTEFVIFDENRRERAPAHTESANDMIPLKL